MRLFPMLCLAGMTACFGPVLSRAETTVPVTLHSYEGRAYALETAELLYTESYEVRMRGNIPLHARTVYLDSSRNVFAERTLDFSAHAWKPGYRFENFRSGRYERAEFRDGEALLLYRSAHGEPEREKRLQVPEPAVVDGGFARFLHDHWDRLIAGERVPFSFIAVSRFDYYSFEIVREPPPSGSASGDAPVFVVRPENALIRLVVAPIRVTYNPVTRRMTEYRGHTNIRDPQGGDRSVHLFYTPMTPPPSL